MHHLSILAVRRPVAVAVVVLIVLLFGGISLQRIPIDLLPDLNFPALFVVTVYPNAPANMVEQDVTIPLEGALAGVSGVRSLDSFSMENVSTILVELDWNTVILEALDEIRSSVAQASLTLPSNIEQPIIARVDPNDSPLMIVGVSSTSLSPFELTRKLESVKPLLEQISGVAEVGLLGAESREVQVLVDEYRLAEFGLSSMLLEQIIALQNTIVPGGAVVDGNTRYTTRAGSRIDGIEQLQDLVIMQQPGTGAFSLGGLIPSIIYLSDIASIREAPVVLDGLTRLNGTDTTMIRIMRQSGANSVQVVDEVERALAQIRASEQDLEFITVLDQSMFIRQSVASLAVNGLLGAVLALIVLFLFLRSMPSLIVIGAAIPLSVVASFIMVYFGGLSLNLMTLGGLALGAGMLVDSSIVVLENIYRHRLEGKEPSLAAEAGSKEVASAIIASTTTTLAVFLPVLYLQSITGALFRELGLTVSFSLLASLVVALTVVPVLSSRLFHRRIHETKSNNAYGPTFSRIQTAYLRQLRYILCHKHIVVIVIVISLVLTALIFPTLGDEFLPETDEGHISIQALLPPGMSLDQLRQIIAGFEDGVQALTDVRSVAIQIGEQGDSDILSLITGSNLTDAAIQLTLEPNRKMSREELSSELNRLAENHGIVRLNILETSLFGSLGGVLTPSFFLEVRGEDPDRLDQLTRDLIEELRRTPGFSVVESTQLQPAYDLFLNVDTSRSILGGMTAGQVGLGVRQATTGIQATEMLVNGYTLPVVLRPNHDVKTLEGLMDSAISSQIGLDSLGSQPLALRSIAEPEVQLATQSIRRLNRMRAYTVTCQLDGIDFSTAVRRAEDVFDRFTLEPGYSINIGGLQDVIEESRYDIYLALTLAVFLVYLVMAAQFESFLHPITIMISVPLALIGAVIALAITGSKLGVMSYIGMIILVGIVVNNAIVFVDYTNLQRRRGLSVDEALMRAGAVRLRPIIMTAVTTILGLLPLAIGIGEGSEIQAPLATAVIGGLVTSTLLTLFVVPVAYSGISNRIGHHLGRNLMAASSYEDED